MAQTVTGAEAAPAIALDLKPQNRFSSQLTGPTVKLILCREFDRHIIPISEYHVHETILYKQSPVFHKLFSSQCTEARKRESNFVTEFGNSDAWELLLEYFYQNKYKYETKVLSERILLDAQVYAYGERLDCIGVKRYALQRAEHHLQTTCGNRADSDLSSRINERTISLSMIPKLIRLIYGYTYDNTIAVLDEMLALEDDNAASKGIAGRGGLTSKDPFRILLCKFCAELLPRMSLTMDFLKVHSEVPEFAMDLLTFLKPGDDLGWKARKLHKSNTNTRKNRVEAKVAFDLETVEGVERDLEFLTSRT